MQSRCTCIFCPSTVTLPVSRLPKRYQCTSISQLILPDGPRRADRFTADRFLTNNYQVSRSSHRDIIYGRQIQQVRREAASTWNSDHMQPSGLRGLL